METLTQEETVAIVELAENNTLHLPKALVHGLHAGERFMVLRNGDTIVLKRISPTNVLDRVATLQDDEPPPTMEKISEM